MERYQGRAYGLALRILRNEDQARDAVQDSFLKVYKSIRLFEGRSTFYTWLYRLVFNQCLDLKRKDKSKRNVEFEDERMGAGMVVQEVGAGGIRAGGFAGPGVELERQELRKLMAEAIDQLPDDARETLLLREVEGLSYSEIAETLGIPRGTVMSRLHYARKRVQQLLIAAGVTPPGEAEKGDAG